MRTRRLLTRGAWLILIAGLAAVLVAGLPGTRSLASALRTNRHALETAERLLGQPAAGKAPEGLPPECPDYPTGIRYLHQGGLTPGETLQRVQWLSACWPPERAILLTGWRADALWALGRHQEVCEVLAAVGAAPRMLSLAKKSSETGDWGAVALYLGCLPKLAPGDTWISPWIVAQLYFGLAQHLEEDQAIDAAIDAYRAAASWYPTVWAAPYQKEAQLIWQQGDKEQAIRLLVDAVSRATDVAASFHLWRQLGQFWVQQGDRVDALCAYRKAAALVDRLPAGNISEIGRRTLTQEMKALEESESPATCFTNYPALTSP
jgi:tetratricopeptide (TPR) repeat protein